MKLQSLFFAWAVFACATLASADTVTGQWDFDNGDWSASIGTDMDVSNLVQSVTFGTNQIFGIDANTVAVPALTTDYIFLPHGAAANAGGAFVNDWTLILDINFTADVAYTSIINTSVTNSNDTDIFRRGSNDGIDIGPSTVGSTPAATWMRLTIVRDATSNQSRVYRDGQLIGTAGTSGVDGTESWDLSGFCFLADNNSETGPVLLDSVQVRDYAMTDAEVLALGAVNYLPIPHVKATFGPFGDQVSGFNYLVEGAANLESTSGSLTVTSATLFDLNGFGSEFTLHPTTFPLTIAEGETNSDIKIDWDPTATLGTRSMGLLLETNQGVLYYTFGNSVNAPVTDGLIAYLPMDGDLSDQSPEGNDNSGTAVGTASPFTGGLMGQAADMSGNTADYISLAKAGGDFDFGDTGDFTVSFWVKVPDLSLLTTPNSGNDWNGKEYLSLIADRHHIYPGARSTGWSIGMDERDSGRIMTCMDGPGDYWGHRNSAVDLTDGGWHHVVMKVDQDGSPVDGTGGRFKLYIDGDYRGKNRNDNIGNVNTANPINIGQDGPGTCPHRIPFQIDDVAIWNREISEAEVGLIYTQGVTGVPLGAVGPQPLLTTQAVGLPGNVSTIDTFPKTMTVRVGNGGVAPLNVTSFTLIGGYASEFTIVNPTSTSLVPSQTIDIDIEWNPVLDDLGQRDVSLSFEHSISNLASPTSVALNRSFLITDDVFPVMYEDFEGLADSLQAAVDESVGFLGWTHTPPAGWTNDNTGTIATGVVEWESWSFATKDFWVASDNQGRSDSLVQNIAAIADGDEHADKSGEGLSTELRTPALTIPKGTELVYLSFISDFQYEAPQTGRVGYAVNGGSDVELVLLNTGGNRNQTPTFVVPAPTTDSFTIEFYWQYDGVNDWWWAIDNIEVTIPTPAVIELTPDPLDFASVSTTGTKTLTMYAQNVGNLPMSISDVLSTAPFSIVSPTTFPLTLNAGTSVALSVAFTPTTPGSFTDTIEVQSDAFNTTQALATLIGDGFLPGDPEINLSPRSLDFGDVVFLTGAVQQTFRVENLGDKTLNVTTMTLTNDSGAFGFVDPTPLALDPATSTTITVTFAPQFVKAYSATLRVESDDPDESTLDIDIVGVGVVPPDLPPTAARAWDLYQ